MVRLQLVISDAIVSMLHAVLFLIFSRFCLCCFIFCDIWIVVCLFSSDSEDESDLSGSDVAEEGNTSEEENAVDVSNIIEGKRRRAPIKYNFDEEDDDDEEDDE